MAVRDAARRAWVTARSDREGQARAALAGTLTPFDTTVLDTVDVQVTAGWTLFVFHDTEDDVHLAARTTGDGWDVLVVTPGGAGWTVLSPPARSLAHLWELLPAAEPGPSHPAWTTGVTYKIGDRVTYEGAVWEAVQGDGAGSNVWRPGEYGWQKVVG